MSELFYCHVLKREISKENLPSFEICLKKCSESCEVAGFIVCKKHGRVPSVQNAKGEQVCSACAFEGLTSSVDSVNEIPR